MKKSRLLLLSICFYLFIAMPVSFAAEWINPGYSCRYFQILADDISKNPFPSQTGKNLVVSELREFNAVPDIFRQPNSLISGLNPLFSDTDPDENINILGMNVLFGLGKLKYNYNDKPLYEFDNVYTKGGGVSLELPLLSLGERFTLYNELVFSQFKATTSQHYTDSAGGDPATNYHDVSVTFAPNSLTVTNSVRYTFTPGDFKYYVALGVYNSFVVSSTNRKETVYYRNGEAESYTEDAVPDPAVWGLMITGTTGFSYRNIGFELRFDPGHNFSNNRNYAIYLPGVSALFHVRFMPK